jgi:hypothetical protein
VTTAVSPQTRTFCVPSTSSCCSYFVVPLRARLDVLAPEHRAAAGHEDHVVGVDALDGRDVVGLDGVLVFAIELRDRFLVVGGRGRRAHGGHGREECHLAKHGFRSPVVIASGPRGPSHRS